MQSCKHKQQAYDHFFSLTTGRCCYVPMKSIFPSQRLQYPLLEAGCGTRVASRLCLSLPSKSTIFCVSLLSYKCVYRHSQGCMPRSWLNSWLNSSVSKIGGDFWGLAEAIVPLHQNLRRSRCIITETTGLEKNPLIYLQLNRKEKLFLCSLSSLKSEILNAFSFIGFKGERGCNYLAFLPQYKASHGPPFSKPSCLPL